MSCGSYHRGRNYGEGNYRGHSRSRSTSPVAGGQRKSVNGPYYGEGGYQYDYDNYVGGYGQGGYHNGYGGESYHHGNQGYHQGYDSQGYHQGYGSQGYHQGYGSQGYHQGYGSQGYHKYGRWY